MNLPEYFGLMLLWLLSLAGCTKQDIITTNKVDEIEETYSDTIFDALDWTASTHGKGADPNFELVFNSEQVQRIDLEITPERWQQMLDNMKEFYGDFGASAGGQGGGPGGPGGQPGTMIDENPVFVPAELFYNDKQWYRVGIRFKGNSSLSSSWSSGIMKLSFKLDFDEFEDEYPQINNQRFYGFKKLSLKNNFSDASCLREKVAAEVFKEAGLAVSHTAFYTLYVDYGEGAKYFGLYTMVEEVDNTVIDTQFPNDNGNLYKPEGNSASFGQNGLVTDEFEKKTNEDEADWTDVQQLYSILHDDSRSEDPEAWRSDLEPVFDVDVFLKYLAVNTIIQNWDTYGRMTHNYYLYAHPDNGKLTWIPWDNNEALQEGKMGGALNLDFSDLEQGTWPLIEYFYNDAVYREKYNNYLQEVINGPFEISRLQTLYNKYSDLVEPYVVAEEQGYTFLNSSSDFSVAISELNQHVQARAQAVENYLNNEK